MLDLVDLNQSLPEALGRSVDVVPYDTLDVELKERILAEQLRIF